jgi:hypothetical protein
MPNHTCHCNSNELRPGDKEITRSTTFTRCRTDHTGFVHEEWMRHHYVYIFPAVFAMFLFHSIYLWLILRLPVSKTIKRRKMNCKRSGRKLSRTNRKLTWRYWWKQRETTMRIAGVQAEIWTSTSRIQLTCSKSCQYVQTTNRAYKISKPL